MTLSESYYQTKLTYSALKSSSIHTFTQLLPNNNRHFFWESEWTLEQTKHSQTENSQWEKLVYTHETDNFAINYSGVYMIGY